MTAHDINADVDGGMEARNAAAARWQAVEAFTYAPGLTPTARRVGIALVCSMDSTSRACFPSEIRLAALCDAHISAIRKAKVELRDAGLIDWHNPGGPRHLCQYGLAWDKLANLAAEAKERANDAVESRGYQPSRFKRQPTHTGMYEEGSHPTRAGMNGGIQPTQNHPHTYPPGALTYPPGASNLPVRVSELSHYPPNRTAQHEYDALACDVTAARASMCVSQPVSQNGEIEEAERSRALEKKAARPRQAIRPYPKLWEAFTNEPAVIDALDHLDSDRLAKASRALALGGLAQARNIIEPNSRLVGVASRAVTI